MKVKLFFAWYDFWIGFYWDRDKRALYIAPLPFIVFKVQRPELSCLKCGHPQEKHKLGAGCFWYYEKIDKYCPCEWAA